MRKQGKFYSAFEDDAYVLHAVLGYKVSNGRVGFPVDSSAKVINELENRKIDFVVIEKDVEVNKGKYSPNIYNKYLKIGKKSIEEIRSEDELIEAIRNLDSVKLEKIFNFIKEVIDE